LLDRVAAVFQDSLVAVNEGDRAFGGRGVHQRGIIGHQPKIVRFRFDLAQVHCSHRSILDWQRVRFAGAIVRNR
jgi:hypothetical protein